MAFYSREQVREIISGRPQNVTPDQIVKELVRRGHSLEGFNAPDFPDTIQKKEQGLAKEIIQDIAAPFISVGLAPVALAQSIPKLIKGDIAGAKEEITRERDVGFFGKVKPIAAEAESFENFFKEVVGTGLEIGSNIIGGGGATKSLAKSAGGTVLKRVGKAATQTGAASALATGGKALREGDTAIEVAKEAFAGGLSGALLGGAGSAVSNTLGEFVRRAPTRLYNDALGVTTKLVEKGKSPSQFLLDKKKWGSLGKILGESQKGIKESNDEITKLLQQSKQTIDSNEIMRTVTDQLKQKMGTLYSDAEIRNIVERSPVAALRDKKVLTVEEGNKVRKQLDRLLGDRFFLSDAQSTLMKQTAGEFANALRQQIKQKAPETVGHFHAESQYIRTRDLINKKIAQTERQFRIGLLDSLSGIFGFSALGGVEGAVKAVAGRRLFESATAKTVVAKTLFAIGQRLETLPTDEAGRVSKIAVINLIKSLLPENNGQDAQIRLGSDEDQTQPTEITDAPVTETN